MSPMSPTKHTLDTNINQMSTIIPTETAQSLDFSNYYNMDFSQTRSHHTQSISVGDYQQFMKMMQMRDPMLEKTNSHLSMRYFEEFLIIGVSQEDIDQTNANDIKMQPSTLYEFKKTRESTIG